MSVEEEVNEGNSCCFLNSGNFQFSKSVFHACAYFVGSVTICAGKVFQEELTDRSRCKEL